MSIAILGIGTSVPPFSIEQSALAEKFISLLSIEPEKASALRKMYQNSAIFKRHSVIPDFIKDKEEWLLWSSNFPQEVHGITLINKIYKKEAPKLALEACKEALKTWGGDLKDISHVISVSCTGMVAPGIEFDVMQELSLNPCVERLGINFMGCFGAFKGISVGQAFAKENPKNRVLVVCTELCSLHFQTELTSDNVLGNSLFADGAAAVILGGEPSKKETPLWNILNKGTSSLEKTKDKMTWDVSDRGFLMRLSPTVPVFLGRNIAPFIDTLLKGDSYENCDWALHPGGKSVLQAIEKALKLTKEQTKASWEILGKYGNMSSATFLFVLKELLKKKSENKKTIGVAFGPGLSMEGLLLERLTHA